MNIEIVTAFKPNCLKAVCGHAFVVHVLALLFLIVVLIVELIIGGKK
mgnify:CR=1 FL=1